MFYKRGVNLTAIKAMIRLEALIPDYLDGLRCDRVAVKMFSDFSRSRLQNWINDGSLLVDGCQLRPKDPVFSGSNMSLCAELEEQERWEPENIPIERIYEDDQLVVIDKPAGLVVHPGAGNPNGTLLNALLHHVPEVSLVPRAGIVHRIDKDTSGLLVVAKTVEAQTSLVKQLQSRTVKREYEAVTQGLMTAGGTVDEPIGRHTGNRLKMAVTTSGKPAVTHFRVIEKFALNTHIRVQLETGRTHQIRVHMAHRRFPLVGDTLYSGRTSVPKGVPTELRYYLRDFPRQALHAAKLELNHPGSGELMHWESPLSDDIKTLLSMLKAG